MSDGDGHDAAAIVLMAMARVVSVIGDAIRTAGKDGVPASAIYLPMAERGMSLRVFDAIIATMIEARIVRRANHRLYWIGPAIHVFSPTVSDPLVCRICGWGIGAIVHADGPEQSQDGSGGKP